LCVAKNVKWWLKICISYLINNHITLTLIKDGHHFGYKYNIQINTLVGNKFKWWKPNTFVISLCIIIKSSQDQSKQKYVNALFSYSIMHVSALHILTNIYETTNFGLPSNFAIDLCKLPFCNGVHNITSFATSQMWCNLFHVRNLNFVHCLCYRSFKHIVNTMIIQFWEEPWP